MDFVIDLQNAPERGLTGDLRGVEYAFLLGFLQIFGERMVDL